MQKVKNGMKKYELWLDESGEFENDKKNVDKNFQPSLIGGVLFEKGKFSKSQAEKLIGQKNIHSNEEEKKEVFNKFKDITNRDVTLIEISNKECISVIDSNLTYQNIMAEGLIQVISKVRESNGNYDAEIDILIAQRGDCTNEHKNDKKVAPEQYKERICERMILEGYRNKIPESCWTIETADAKKDKRLMIADIVCNSFLTRDTKFRGEQGEYINEIHNRDEKTWKFSVFESSMEKAIKQLLLDGQLGEAVISLCQSPNEQYILKKMDEISSYMKSLAYDDIHLQFEIISSRVAYYIKIVRKYKECLVLLNNLLKHWVPAVENLPQSWGKELAGIMELDFYIHEYTIYTHQGELKKTEECEKHCEKIFNALKRKLNMESLEYLLMYANRKITNKMNRFEFELALSDCKNLVERCEKIKEAINLSDEGLILFDELGKSLGTRAQIYMFMIRNNSRDKDKDRDKDFYQCAEEDAKNAIKEFQNKSDIRRQQLYLTQIYTEVKQYDKALNVLCDETQDMKQCLKNAEEKPFEVYAFIRLMAEGKCNGWEKADDMYDELNKTSILSKLKITSKIDHPYEVTVWKLGSYYMQCGNKNAAKEYFDKAIECGSFEEQLTIKVICFAAELERYALSLKENLQEKNIYQKQLKKHFELIFRSENTPDSIRNIYTDIDYEKKDWHYFVQLSRKITY